MKAICFMFLVLSACNGVLNAETNAVRSKRQTGCLSNPCRNGGACLQQDANGFICQCRRGYSGTLCQDDINECATNPCANGEVCFQITPPPQFGALYICGPVPTACTQNPCVNGGSCRESGSSYICSCPFGYSGTNCQITPNPCSPNPCMNGGTCQSASTSFTCTCTAAFSGPTCTVPSTSGGICVPPCTGGTTCFQTTPQFGSIYQCGVAQCSPNPCQNGAGCTILVGIAQCQCRQGFTGTLCEKTADTCFPGSSHVVLRGGSNLPLSRIRIGDEVLTQDDTDQLRFSAVIAFLDYKPNAKVDYLRIGTENNTVMSISPLHLIAVMRDGVKQFIHARRVQTGDELFVHREGAFSLERVSSIHERVDEGAFAPLTETGTVVVDGVVASCYAVVNSHEVGHWALTPLRWWGMMKKHFSLLPDESREGVHAFAGWLYSVAPGYLFS